MHVFLCCNGVPHISPRKAAGWWWLEKHLLLRAGQGAAGSAAALGAEPLPKSAQVAGSRARGVLGELIRANPINISQRCGPVINTRIIWEAGWDGGAVPSET